MAAQVIHAPRRYGPGQPYGRPDSRAITKPRRPQQRADPGPGYKRDSTRQWKHQRNDPSGISLAKGHRPSQATLHRRCSPRDPESASRPPPDHFALPLPLATPSSGCQLPPLQVIPWLRRQQRGFLFRPVFPMYAPSRHRRRASRHPVPHRCRGEGCRRGAEPNVAEQVASCFPG